ncbi:MAG: hypothetical protein U0802_16080 [Candidatus Binatia bacterium]
MNPNNTLCTVPTPSGFKLYNNTQNQDDQAPGSGTRLPDGLTNLEQDPFEVIYAKNEFLNEDPAIPDHSIPIPPIPTSTRRYRPT